MAGTGHDFVGVRQLVALAQAGRGAAQLWLILHVPALADLCDRRTSSGRPAPLAHSICRCTLASGSAAAGDHVLLRSRLARIERLRSMRRWHLLYSSHSSMAPTASSHLSCLGKGLRALGEYHFYLRIAHRVMDEAAAELLRARMVHGLRMWRLALRRLEHTSAWGPLSVARRCLTAWVSHVESGADIEAEALARAERWVAYEGGAKAPRIAKLRAWRDVAAAARARWLSAAAVYLSVGFAAGLLSGRRSRRGARDGRTA